MCDGEYVEGDLCTDWLYENEIHGMPEGKVYVIMEGIMKWQHIDPSTLEISFNRTDWLPVRVTKD